MHPGQPVEIEVDTFPGATFNGHVDSIAPASGQEFALLPPDNATGNFTKVVQRIPVKIVLDPAARLPASCGPACRSIRPSTPRPQQRAAAARSVQSAADASGHHREARPCRTCAATLRSTSVTSPGRSAGAGTADKASLTAWIAVLASMIGAFMAILNIQITNASLLDIEGGIGTGVDNGAWISTSYLIGEIVVIPLTDYLSQVFSFRRYMHRQRDPVPAVLDRLRVHP